MRLLGCLVVALTACGRIAFDATSAGAIDATADVASGHDEDQDGVPDSVDVCPHVPDDQQDADGDRVGARCDPDDVNTAHAIVLFDPMTAIDPTVTLVGAWQSRADELELTGTDFARLDRPLAITSAEIWVGLEITAEAPTGLRQVIVHPSSMNLSPRYYGQLYMNMGVANEASISRYDGTFTTLAAAQLTASGIHVGVVQARLRVDASASTMEWDARWPNEPYTIMASIPAYTGTPEIRIQLEGIGVRIQYQCVIAPAP